MARAAERSVVALGAPVSVTLDPSPTIKLSRDDIDELLGRNPRRYRPLWVLAGIVVAFSVGAWVATKVPVVPPLPPKVVPVRRVIILKAEQTFPAASAPEPKRLLRKRAPPVDTKHPLFNVYEAM